MPLPNIFSTCIPRPDVLSGALTDEQFAADLSQVINNTAAPAYQSPALFFQNTHPTRGLRSLLTAVCSRLSGRGGEVASILRLGTQYGGGKTHSLIALVHAARGMQGVSNVADFFDPALLPNSEVRIAAINGEVADPANGLAFGNLRIRSIWGELAYLLAGPEGYETLRVSDERHIAPGTETIRQLFGGQPTLILLDEIAVYLRKAEAVFPGASAQFTPFLQSLLQAVASSPNVALVYTLARREDATAQKAATDSFQLENERAYQAFLEADKVAARTSTILNPTEEDETAAVLRTRLFSSINSTAAAEVIEAYVQSWRLHEKALPADAISPELRDTFTASYPFHPKLLELLTVKTSSLQTFQRTRGMLRLLSRTVNHLWKLQPPDALAIHTHHMDPGYEHIRTEILEKLGQKEFNPALKADIASVPGAEPSIAQQIDQQRFPNQPPITAYVARTIFWHTLAFGEANRGISPERLRLSVLTPSLEPAFLDQARVLFIQQSTFLDDRSGAPLRFMAEPNLNQIIRRHEAEVSPDDIRSFLKERITNLYAHPKNDFFQAVLFPAGPYDLSDEIGNGQPYLAVMSYETCPIPDLVDSIPEPIAELYRYKGTTQATRTLRNNLVFVAASARLVPDMQAKVRRRLALEALRKPDQLSGLAPHQRNDVDNQFKQNSIAVSTSIQQAYRHIFYPSNNALQGPELPLAHATIEKTNPPDTPGNGIELVQDVLAASNKLIFRGAYHEKPDFVLQQSGLKFNGELSTAQLWRIYKSNPKLALLIEPSPLIQSLREGVSNGTFVYREGNQVWGQGDPTAAVRIADDCFIHTLEDASTKQLWPRAEPLILNLYGSPNTVNPGESARLILEISGGIPPYSILASDPRLSDAATSTLQHTILVSPTQAQAYEVTVTDSRKTTQKTSTYLYVRTESATSPGDPDLDKGGTPPPIIIVGPAPPVAPVRKSKDLTDEGAIPVVLPALFQRARKENFSSIESIRIDAKQYIDAQKILAALISFKSVPLAVIFEGFIVAEGISHFSFEFKGSPLQASQVRNNLDGLIRAASEVDFKSSFSFTFPTPLPLSAPAPEDFLKSLNFAGAAEVFVGVTVSNADALPASTASAAGR